MTLALVAAAGGGGGGVWPAAAAQGQAMSADNAGQWLLLDSVGTLRWARSRCLTQELIKGNVCGGCGEEFTNADCTYLCIRSWK